MLTLVTGSPGSGKSHWLVEQLLNLTDREIFVSGVPELAIDYKELNDPKNWHEEVPDGSLVVIDEVQRIFGTRSPKSTIPPAVTALETHRHRGLDVIFLTQYPTLLDHHARRLVGRHIHLVRPKGMSFANLYDSDVVIDQPNDKKSLRGLEKKIYKYKSEVWQYYKSAEIHNVKKRIPRQVYIFGGLVLGVIVWV